MIRGVAQLVSVRVWGACGRWFESSHPDIKNKAMILSIYYWFHCLFSYV